MMFRSVILYFIVTLLYGFQINQAFVIHHDSDLDMDKSSKEPLLDDQSVMPSLSPSSLQQLAEDDALLKTVVQKATNEDSNSDFAKEVEAMFLSTVFHMLGQGELYRDARIEAITAALEAAFLATTGKVDHDYIEKVLEAIRDKDEQDRRRDMEHQTNIFGFEGFKEESRGFNKQNLSEDLSKIWGTSLPPTLDDVAGLQ